MAPSAVVEEPFVAPTTSTKWVGKNDQAPRDIFPDGIRTSGQHNPIYEQLRPYEDFPKEITGPTLWTKEQFENQPERWTHRFTPEEVDELSKTADAFIARGIPLTGISKVRRSKKNCVGVEEAIC